MTESESPFKSKREHSGFDMIGDSLFDDFLREKGISPEDERAKVAREAWNNAIEAAREYVLDAEGTDFDIVNHLAIKAKKG